jgi:hypothetical protein
MSDYTFDPAQVLAGLGGTDAQPDTGAGITSSPTGDALDDLRHAILFLQSYMEKSQDDQDIAAVSKATTSLQTILAQDAKDQDAALGVTPLHRAMRKAY